MKELNSLDILKNIPNILASSDDVEKNMALVIEQAKSVLKNEYVAIYYFSEQNATLKYPINSKDFTDFILNTKQIEELEEKEYIKLPKINALTQINSNFIYLFPLKIRTTVFGFLAIAYDSQLSEIEIATLCALASIASYSIKDAELSNVFKIQLKTLQSSIQDKTKDLITIKEQNEKILEADKAKNEFIANISHELRTPLNAIIGFSEVLNSKIFGELNEKQAEYINDIYTSGVHLLGMINEILDISKLESKAMKITCTKFSLETAINEVISVMTPLAQKKNIQIIFENDLKTDVFLDYQKIQQILYNLLSNAIKFTHQDGEINIKTTQKGSMFELSVKDNGEGIDAKHHDKIFDKFVQLENTYTKTGSSTGLGLTITKCFIDMMNGSITLKSEKGKGANFIITLPIEGKNV